LVTLVDMCDTAGLVWMVCCRIICVDFTDCVKNR
jgi:hypothetical protein